MSVGTFWNQYLFLDYTRYWSIVLSSLFVSQYISSQWNIHKSDISVSIHKSVAQKMCIAYQFWSQCVRDVRCGLTLGVFKLIKRLLAPKKQSKMPQLYEWIAQIENMEVWEPSSNVQSDKMKPIKKNVTWIVKVWLCETLFLSKCSFITLLIKQSSCFCPVKAIFNLQHINFYLVCEEKKTCEIYDVLFLMCRNWVIIILF